MNNFFSLFSICTFLYWYRQAHVCSVCCLSFVWYQKYYLGGQSQFSPSQDVQIVMSASSENSPSTSLNVLCCCSAWLDKIVPPCLITRLTHSQTGSKKLRAKSTWAITNDKPSLQTWGKKCTNKFLHHPMARTNCSYNPKYIIIWCIKGPSNYGKNLPLSYELNQPSQPLELDTKNFYQKSMVPNHQTQIWSSIYFSSNTNTFLFSALTAANT